MVTEKLPPLITRQIQGVEPWPTPRPRYHPLGSTAEFVGYNNGTDLDTIQGFAKDMGALFPFLRKVHIIRTYAGIRPATRTTPPSWGASKRWTVSFWPLATFAMGWLCSSDRQGDRRIANW